MRININSIFTTKPQQEQEIEETTKNKTIQNIQEETPQAKRDEKQFNELHAKHESDRKRWKDSDKKKDDLIDELTKMFK